MAMTRLISQPRLRSPSDGLIVAFYHGPGHVLLTVTGECDVATCDQFRAAMEQMVTPGTDRLIVDLSGLTFLDSTGIHTLVDAQAMLTAAGHRLVLARPQPIVARILSLSGVDQLIRVVGTVAEALAAE
jgi:anti-sigma B factor antagonist